MKKLRSIGIQKRDLQNLKAWAAQDGLTPERYLGLMFARERIRRGPKGDEPCFSESLTERSVAVVEPA